MITDIIQYKLYYFDCTQCKKTKRQSTDPEKARKGLCRKCRNNYIDPRQVALFQL